MSSDKARWGLTTLYTVAGFGHFVTPKPFEEIVPTYAPGTARFWNYLSGAVDGADRMDSTPPAATSHDPRIVEDLERNNGLTRPSDKPSQTV